MNADHSNNNKHKPQSKSHRSNSITQHSEDSIQAGNSHQRTQETSAPPPVNVVVNISEDNKWKRADIISASALIVAIAMAFVTYRLFNQTLISTKAAVKADSIAQASLEESKVNNAIALKHQNMVDSGNRITDSMRNRREGLTFEIQRKGLDAQIASLKETQRQFKIINRPYLQFSAFRFTKGRNGDFISYDFILKNYGVAPVRVVSKKIKVAAIGNNVHLDFDRIIKTAKKNPVLSYVNADGLTIEEDTNIPARILDNFYSNGSGCFYVIGEIEYVNLINNRNIIYKFRAKIVDFKTEYPCAYLLF